VLCCVDVDYQAAGVTTACVGFASWGDAVAQIELVVRTPGPAAAYQPGAFYERELPYLVAALARMPVLAVIVVDAYVWLGPDHAGLGWHVHERTGVPVIGVAKTRFAGAAAIEIVRGDSAKPLMITAIGLEAAEAADHIGAMHGEYRVPTLLRLVDALARGHR
jgi:deoxyribonuclease V